MSRIKRYMLFAGSAFLFVGVFLYDVARMSAAISVGGIGYVREAVIISGFILAYVIINKGRRNQKREATQQIGKLLALTLVMLFMVSLVFFMQGDSATGEGAGEVSVGALITLLSYALGITLGLFGMITLLTVKDLVLQKRKKGTQRNFVIYLVLLFAATLSALPVLSIEGTIITTMFYPLALVFIVVISFKQNWIVFLSRREKLYAVLYGSLLFVGFLILIFVLTSRNVISSSLLMFDAPVQRFVQINSILGAVYFGMAFVTTLFHLPTAEVYDRKQSEITSLHNLSRLINQVFDFSDLIETVTQMTLEVCGAKSAWLELLRAQDGNAEPQFDVVSHKNISKEHLEHVSSGASLSLRQIVMESKRVVLIDEARSDKRTRHIKATGLSIGSMLSVPLVSQGELIGILHATKDFEFGFDQDDIDVLTTFADHVSIAIENSKLIAKSLERERLLRELAVAQEMQKRLLPHELPAIPSLEIAAVSEPSMEVGGDYYDFVHLDRDRLGIVVGDVSGKGVSAAFYMAEVKGIFQSLSKLCSSPRELLINANQALEGSLERKDFISLLYGIFEIPKSRLTLARAGHCPMVYISDDGAELMRPLGLGLGLTNGEVFEQSTKESIIELKPGDLCVFYTDGITESRTDSGEEFGYDRLVQTIQRVRGRSADKIKDTIVQEVKSFRGNSTYGDDMTLVVVKWLGAPAAAPASELEMHLSSQEGGHHHD